MKKLGQGTHFTKPGASQAQKLWISMKKKGFVGRPYSVVVVMPQFAAEAGNLGHNRVVGKI